MKKKPVRLKTENYKKWLKNELEFRFPKFIITRDKKCVICGTTKNLTNGHYFPRKYLGTKRDDRNCNCQCSTDNSKHNDNHEPYRRFMVVKYGESVLLELEQLHDSLHQPSIQELEEKILKYAIQGIDPHRYELMKSKIKKFRELSGGDTNSI